MPLQVVMLAKDNKNSRATTAWVRDDNLSLDVIQVYWDKGKIVGLFRGINNREL